MTRLRWRWPVCGVLVALATLLVPGSALACPFCLEQRGPTLMEDFADSSMVLYGHFINPKPAPAGGIQNGTTDFVIEKVLKHHDVLKGKTVLTLPIFIPAKSTFLLFCDVANNGYINPIRGEDVIPPTELLTYLERALKVKDEPVATRLRVCFDYLTSADTIVSMDAYREFAKADYPDYKDMAKSLPAKTIAGWLEDDKTPPYRYGLYASLLGHCGDAKLHGGLLRGMLDDPKKRQNSGLDGLMAGYVMLQPSEAWDYMEGIIKHKDSDFYMQYAVLTTMRFFWETRVELIGQQKILQTMKTIVELPDVSDFAIENLRSWQAWSMTDQVLDLFNKESHNIGVVKRAIMRYALSNPSPRAAAFVREQRQRDPVWVGDIEELLRDVPQPNVPVEKK